MVFDSLAELLDYACRDRYMVTDQEWTEDVHGKAEEGDIRQWSDGRLHRKTSHGWETVSSKTKIQTNLLESYSKSAREKIHKKKQQMADEKRKEAAKRRRIQQRELQDRITREAAKTDYKDIKQIKNIDEIPINQFSEPNASYEMPALNNIIKNDVRPVLLKKSVFLKNKFHHMDLTAEQSKEILQSALYGKSKVIQKTGKNSYIVLINQGSEIGRMAVVDTEPHKDRIEIVGWRYSNKNDNERLKKKGE